MTSQQTAHPMPAGPTKDMAWVPGGRFLMGSDDHWADG
jgi:formylglycine-generating enzyme required for sulfatase activity